ncbi:MAG: flagellar basal body rod C-terminal domain-containing protein, partial [Verrucomicrobiota bacterium]|nr:flagellar basal body rod C-terminal domain-containing protein [Verrucomicrobiota bacterium]
GDPQQGIPGENGYGTLNQGAIEKSNVKVIEEMVNMIVAQRAFEVNSKAIKSADEMMSQTNNLKR